MAEVVVEWTIDIGVGVVWLDDGVPVTRVVNVVKLAVAELCAAIDARLLDGSLVEVLLLDARLGEACWTTVVVATASLLDDVNEEEARPSAAAELLAAWAEVDARDVVDGPFTAVADDWTGPADAAWVSAAAAELLAACVDADARDAVDGLLTAAELDT